MDVKMMIMMMMMMMMTTTTMTRDGRTDGRTRMNEWIELLYERTNDE